MTIRSMKWAAGVSLFAAVLAVGTTLPERQASAQVQAVPRAGIGVQRHGHPAGHDRVGRSRRPHGGLHRCPTASSWSVPVADSVGNLAAIQDGSTANVTYNQIVTILNLRQKGPGSKEERRDSMNQAQHHRYRVRPLHA